MNCNKRCDIHSSTQGKNIAGEEVKQTNTEKEVELKPNS